MRNCTRIFIFLTGVLLTIQTQAQWAVKFTGTPAPVHDRPYIYMVSVVDSNTVWAILGRAWGDFRDNRFLRTSDGGNSWHQGIISDVSTEDFTVNIFGVDSLNAWAIRCPFSNERCYVYNTIDGGLNWSEVMVPILDDSFAMLALHFFNAMDGVIYGEAHDGTAWHIKSWYTQDGGASWNTANSPYLAGERVFNWHGNNNYAVQGDTMWFGTSLSRVFRSIDKGHNWTAVDVPFYHTRIVESVAFLDAKNGIAATALSDSLGGQLAFNEALRTEDGGETWTHIPIPRAEVDTEPILVGLAAIPNSNSAYILHGYWNSNFAYKQMISLDHGLTWNYVTGPQAKTRCLQFISPTEGWAGGFAYINLQNTYVEQLYKWVGPAILGETSNDNEWNRLQEALELTPNPAVDQAFLQIKQDEDAKFKVEVFDMKGSSWYSTDIKNNTRLGIPIENWPSGAYIFKITGDSGIVARTIIKQ